MKGAERKLVRNSKKAGPKGFGDGRGKRKEAVGPKGRKGRKWRGTRGKEERGEGREEGFKGEALGREEKEIVAEDEEMGDESGRGEEGDQLWG
ncbi:hypothetical protein QUC31_019874 [Theobroma cacao]